MITGGLRVVCTGLALVMSMFALAATALADRGVLEAVRSRGYVVCGVADGPKGYSSVSPQGVWSGISVDFCRAIAASVIGTKDAVKFRPLHLSTAILALQSGEIDVLSHSLGVTSTRDTSLGVRFPAVLVYDSLGFMVRKSQSITSALELSGARVCVTGETSDERDIADYFANLKMPVELMKFAKWSDAVMAYANKGCMVLSADMSTLALARQQQTDNGDHILLPEMAARQPVGPAVRQGDEEWFSIVRWTLYALVAAEELGITAATVDAARNSHNADVRRFLGIDADLGRPLGLSADWTQRIVRQVGNYGELFDRNLGQKSTLKLERRLNGLAANGGLQYAPPFR